jgi:hypothetical protein
MANNDVIGEANSILGKLSSFGKNTVSAAVTNVSSPETGSYIMNILFYLLFISFIIFLILTLIHFTITPIFRFTPESKGYIGVPGISDSGVYWTQVPAALDSAPNPNDKIIAYPFENNFSFSFDCVVTKLSDTSATNRLILFKTFDMDGSGKVKSKQMTADELSKLCGTQTSPTSVQTKTDEQNLQTYMARASSMIVYLTETNDLVVTFFVGSTPTIYNSRPIRNIPLNNPFRVTVVVQERLFTVYLNGKQTFQRMVTEGIGLNSSNQLNTTSQRFYAPPTWAEQPKKTIYIQNLILWPRAISYGEVTNASPALATLSSFNIPSDVSSASCA